MRTSAGWGDYLVEVDIPPQSAKAGLVLRCSQDLQSYVLIMGSDDSLWWIVVNDGATVAMGNVVQSVFLAPIQHLRPSAVDSSYGLHVNDLLRLDFTDTRCTQSMPGLAGNAAVWGIAPWISRFPRQSSTEFNSIAAKRADERVATK